MNKIRDGQKRGSNSRCFVLWQRLAAYVTAVLLKRNRLQRPLPRRIHTRPRILAGGPRQGSLVAWMHVALVFGGRALLSVRLLSAIQVQAETPLYTATTAPPFSHNREGQAARLVQPVVNGS
jgi:hypothetical protein